MAGPSLKLVNKLARRSRYVKERQRSKYDRENKLELELRKSPRAYKLARKPQRRLDRNWGKDAIAQKPLLAFEALALLLDRHDYSGMGDFGMRLQLAAGLEAAIGLQVGDVIRIRQGKAKGQELLVKALTDSTHIRLDDLASYAIAGVAERTQVTTVADVAGSKSGTFFNLNSALNSHLYYVWLDDGMGVDPAPMGRTAIHVVYVDGASASTLAGLIASAVAAAGGGLDFSASALGSVVTITNLATGATNDATDGSVPTGFGIAVTRQGVTANASPSESNINFRALLSSEKKSWS